jgi:ABC-type transport system involved in multi-copper enzyme maturation permease subunit
VATALKKVPGSSVHDAFVNFVVWIVGMTGIAYVVFRRKDILS